MTIVRWDPFRDFGFTSSNTWMPPVDIFQTGDHELVLKAELPDMSREDIDITVENFVLTVKGEKKRSRGRSRSTSPRNRARAGGAGGPGSFPLFQPVLPAC